MLKNSGIGGGEKSRGTCRRHAGNLLRSNPCFIVSTVREQESDKGLTANCERPCESHRQGAGRPYSSLGKVARALTGPLYVNAMGVSLARAKEPR